MPPDITNIFDFADYLEGLNRDPGTANENRAFVFQTVSEGLKNALIPEEMYSVYTDLGFQIPNNVYNAIVENRSLRDSAGDIIQFFAPTSPIPSFDLPEYKYNISVKDIPYDFITYADIKYQSLITGDIITKTDSYLAYDDVFTPSELRSEIATAFSTAYQAKVISVDLRRSYQSLTQ